MNLESSTEVSVIVPISERYDDVRDLYPQYRRALEESGRTFEFVYVLDGEFPGVTAQLQELKDQGEIIKIVKLARWFGEATALTAGFENSSGDVILTLPAYYQVEPSEIKKVLNGLESGDMVIGRRFPRADSHFNRIQTRLFSSILRLITGDSFHDLGCAVRAFRRRVILEVPVYGDQHRFLPLLASRQGFKVEELDVAQSKKDSHLRMYQPGVYARRLLDILTVFFLIKFTKKPLRFFGLIGSATFLIGGLLIIYLVIERLFFGVELGARPALLLSSLLVVLGVQVFALGLIGELIIFTHAKDIKEYTIEEIIN